jgi:hypothetical protein
VQEKKLQFWHELEYEIDQLSGKYPAKGLLFRGVSDSRWKLSTTLERAGAENMALHEYWRLLASIRPALETFSDRKWSLGDMDSASPTIIEELLRDPQLLSLHRFPSADLYSYMVYLRHYGFPSPLLDWSSSPFVAAFFAFRHLGDAACRSIYVYCEMPKGMKVEKLEAPEIRPIGPYVRSHPRHFRQQSDYTICASYEQNVWRFRPYDSVFDRTGDEQDLLWKFTLPSTERTKVLRVLNYHNLNAYSLFDSEESLLETLWFKEYDSTLGQ